MVKMDTHTFIVKQLNINYMYITLLVGSMFGKYMDHKLVKMELNKYFPKTD